MVSSSVLSVADASKEACLSEAEYAALIAAVGELKNLDDLALIKDAEFDQAIDSIKVGGSDITLAAKGRLRKLKSLAVKQVTAPPKADSKPSARKTKLSSVLDQSCEAEVQRLDADHITKLYVSYERKRGGLPHEDCDPSVDQISAYHQAMGDGTLPYADFSVFGPHGDRLAKKLKFASYSFSPDGTWTRTELPGPPDFQSWW
eukprot:6470165-Amphidinium_carterae.1